MYHSFDKSKQSLYVSVSQGKQEVDETVQCELIVSPKNPGPKIQTTKFNAFSAPKSQKQEPISIGRKDTSKRKVTEQST